MPCCGMQTWTCFPVVWTDTRSLYHVDLLTSNTTNPIFQMSYKSPPLRAYFNKLAAFHPLYGFDLPLKCCWSQDIQNFSGKGTQYWSNLTSLENWCKIHRQGQAYKLEPPNISRAWRHLHTWCWVLSQLPELCLNFALEASPRKT